jgi:Icc-related predicted phosphoesterase
MIKKVCMVSDLHHKRVKIEECDLLIDAGDWTGRGQLHAVLDHFEWLEEQPARHIVTVPGNHELEMERNLPLFLDEIKKRHPAIHVLIDQTIEIEGVKIHGSPITPEFCNWAWNRERGHQIRKHWDLIPDDVQILVTHGPPQDILDLVYFANGLPKEHAGCFDLAQRIKSLKNLKLHVFGHIHSGSGIEMKNGVTYVNAAICDEMYYPSNPVRVIEFEDDEFQKETSKSK